MKKNDFILMLFAWLFLTQVNAQSNQITSFEYWVDDSYAQAQAIPLSPAESVTLQTNLDLSTVQDGFHTLHIRFQDDQLKYSAVLSQLFVAKSLASDFVQYEYWFDMDDASKIVQTITPSPALTLQTQLDASGLSNGLHMVHIRFLDNGGKWSAVQSQFFQKSSDGGTSTMNGIKTYEYWFDDNYAQATTVTVPSVGQFNLQTTLDASSLVNGIHRFHIRFEDEGGNWSSVMSQMIQKSGNGTSTIPLITAYRYWLDSAYTEINHIQLSSPVNPYHLLENLDFTAVPKGEHRFHIQFKDTAGLWSSVLTDTVLKNALPIANFSFNASQANCDSTVVTLVNQSFDADTYHWDFGDGRSSSDSLPLLTYYTPGTYTITLTASDSQSQLDSVITTNITVGGPSFHSFQVQSCFTYSSPSGNYTWNESGTYQDTILNHFGCDSILTIELTIQTVDATAINTDNLLSASASGLTYQWIDCSNGNQIIPNATDQTFQPTSNGSYAVIVDNGTCSDTSTCLIVNNLAVDPIVDTWRLQVFPNPFDGLLTIAISQEDLNYHVSIKDMTGRIVDSKSSLSGISNTIDLSKLVDGTYYLEIQLNHHNIRIPVVKN